MRKNEKKLSAKGLYLAQNKVLHTAFAESGMPYRENKDEWIKLFQGLAGRKRISGLSDLTLSERHKLVVHFRTLGIRLFSPVIPPEMGDWKKGDLDVSYGFRVGDTPQLRLIYGLWAEMGYQQKSLRGLVLKRFKKDDVRWLSDAELDQLANIVVCRARSKGVNHYYKRNKQGHS